MTFSYNQILLIGPIGYVESKTKIARGEPTTWTKVRVALDRSRQARERGETSIWMTCTAWGQTAERLAKAVKGQRIFIVGTLDAHTWTPDGTDRPQVLYSVQIREFRWMGDPIAKDGTQGPNPHKQLGPERDYIMGPEDNSQVPAGAYELPEGLSVVDDDDNPL